MNIKLILFSSFCFIASTISAQTFQTIPLKKNGRPEFLGANKQYFFFDAYGNKMLAINRSNVQEKKMIEFDSVIYFGSNNIIFNNNEIIYLKTLYKVIKVNENSTKSFNNGFSITICDLMTGKATKNKRIFLNDTSSKGVNYSINKENKTISFYRKDSLIDLLDYQLNQVEHSSDKYIKKYSNDFDPLDIDMSLLKDLFKDFKFSFDISITKDKYNFDSFSFSDYNLKYSNITDDNIKYFKGYYKSIVIYNKSNTDSFEIDFPSDKRIVEIEFKLNNANQLIFFGKCANMNNDNYIYEMFSTVIDQNINVVSNLKFFDLTNINYGIGEFYPFRENAGLVYCKLKSPDYEFQLKEEKVRVNFYQKRYSNIYDIIYIVKIHDNGEIVINKVVSQIKNDEKLPSLLYNVVQVKNKFNIIWYENEVNMQNAVYDMKHRFILTDVKQKTTHLTTTTYNPIEDEFTDKKIIASKSEIKDFLNMNFSHAYYDENDHSTYFFVIGVDKKNRVKNLYIFNYTN